MKITGDADGGVDGKRKSRVQREECGGGGGGGGGGGDHGAGRGSGNVVAWLGTV